MGKKKAKFGREPQPKKSARVDPYNQQSDEKTPVWSLSVLDHEGPWGWSAVSDSALLREIHQTLKSYESMDWSHILHRSGCHSIPTQQLCKEAIERLRELRQDDVSDLISMRKDGAGRIWGIKDRNILKILWWDPEHTVYPVEKKHT